MTSNTETNTPKPKGELTTIRILKETASSLKDIGKKGETYDTVIAKLIDRKLRRKHTKE